MNWKAKIVSNLVDVVQKTQFLAYISVSLVLLVPHSSPFWILLPWLFIDLSIWSTAIDHLWILLGYKCQDRQPEVNEETNGQLGETEDAINLILFGLIHDFQIFADATESGSIPKDVTKSVLNKDLREGKTKSSPTLDFNLPVIEKIWEKIQGDFPKFRSIMKKIRPMVAIEDLTKNPPRIWIRKICESPKDFILCELGAELFFESSSVDIPLIGGKFFDLLPFGLNYFHLLVKIRVRVGPFNESKTFFGDIEIGLLEFPDVDYEFSGLLQILNRSLIKTPILSISRFIAQNMLIHPNSYVIKSKEFARITPTEPYGLLKIFAPQVSHLSLTAYAFLRISIGIGKFDLPMTYPKSRSDSSSATFAISQEDVKSAVMLLQIFDLNTVLPLVQSRADQKSCDYDCLAQFELVVADAVVSPKKKFSLMYENVQLGIHTQIRPVQISEFPSTCNYGILSLLIISIDTDLEIIPRIGIKIPGRVMMFSTVGLSCTHYNFREEFPLVITDPRLDLLNLVVYNVDLSFAEEDLMDTKFEEREAALEHTKIGAYSLRCSDLNLSGETFTLRIDGKTSLVTLTLAAKFFNVGKNLSASSSTSGF